MKLFTIIFNCDLNPQEYIDVFLMKLPHKQYQIQLSYRHVYWHKHQMTLSTRIGWSRHSQPVCFPICKSDTIYLVSNQCQSKVTGAMTLIIICRWQLYSCSVLVHFEFLATQVIEMEASDRPGCFVRARPGVAFSLCSIDLQMTSTNTWETDCACLLPTNNLKSRVDLLGGQEG